MSKRSASTGLVNELNRALALEYAATVQYLQQSFLVTGTERQVFPARIGSGSPDSISGRYSDSRTCTYPSGYKARRHASSGS